MYAEISPSHEIVCSLAFFKKKMSIRFVYPASEKPSSRDSFPLLQGSSENDGRSDVYDCLELKVTSNCCYNKCCRTNLPEFT